MKRSGRTLKQRLYGLKHLPSRLRRARYFRGHGVHSPFVYTIVRKVFMRSRLIEPSQHDLYDALCGVGVKNRRAIEIQNLATHCQYQSWSIDRNDHKCALMIVTLHTSATLLASYAQCAHRNGTTLCIVSPYDNAERWRECQRIIEAHTSTSVDKRGYLLIFNNGLPLQRFRI